MSEIVTLALEEKQQRMGDMVNPGFRSMARDSLERAKSELGSGDPERLKYAALELRFAMEAVTYDRALAFKDEIPPEEYKTWQPRKLMQVLHDIDPKIGMTSTIRMGRQDDINTPAPPERMQTLGTDVVLTLADLKRHYDAIGSYLHMPSLDQVMGNKAPDPQKLRRRCEDAVALLDRVLSSAIWNSTFGSFSVLDECMNSDCKKPVRKRLPSGATTVEARCFECDAEYVLTRQPGGKVLWEPKIEEASCPTEGCSETVTLWPHQVRPGVHWRCSGCGLQYGLTWGIVKFEQGNPA
ncbi:hypothetical protein [Azospirillum isscasi]|uniref:Uncharacterized protein n=1 Tax=Azospirillum isscasi TaxID=3053926 RepID=A0ABU0WQG0_9PROT|nr:hypothetical protein [Azospirillum isscasi]MDQ2106480.1 hypothetical protein [Azospirillum isscasi]